jgi:hypothetical protein
MIDWSDLLAKMRCVLTPTDVAYHAHAMKGRDIRAEERQDGIDHCSTTTTSIPIGLGKQPPVEAQLPFPPRAALDDLEHAVRAEAEQVRGLGVRRRAVAADLIVVMHVG